MELATEFGKLMTIINLVLYGVGLYVLILAIKALRIYIKKNS